MFQLVNKRVTGSPNFSPFQEFIYYKHYSRVKADGGQETWHDTCLRIINGMVGIRKKWHRDHGLAWDEDHWQELGSRMLQSLWRLRWSPPGRGLWAMGTPAMDKLGSSPLVNCAFTILGEDWVGDLAWMMDMLMCGSGVGFKPELDELMLHDFPVASQFDFVVSDSREGWVESVRHLLECWLYGWERPVFDYSQIRKKGSPIRTFGGTASGPAPLIKLHSQINRQCLEHVRGNITTLQLLTDLANMIGCCVVSGNVRRGAEIGISGEDEFFEFKDYDKYPDRGEWGWMSNNSRVLESTADYDALNEIALANIKGHDVGYLNMKTLPYGRVGKFDKIGRENELDYAVGLNPCGEIPLEDKEICNIGETYPTRCADEGEWLMSCEFTTIYCSTVALLPTHHECTNAVVARNRRIGVGLVDYTGWKMGTNVVPLLRDGYKIVRRTNARLASEAGVPESIRVTTVKPGGTMPKMAGRTSGASHPTFDYTLRRVRVGVSQPIWSFLTDAGVPGEPDVNDPEGTWCFEFPLYQGPSCPAGDVSVWEQAMNVVTLQREWADNAVSNTLYFRPRWELVNVRAVLKDEETGYNVETRERRTVVDGMTTIERLAYGNEEGVLGAILEHIAPLTKSVSLLPHTDKGAFPQMPEEGISKAEYERRVASFPYIDWSTYRGGDGEDEKYCSSAICES